MSSLNLSPSRLITASLWIALSGCENLPPPNVPVDANVMRDAGPDAARRVVIVGDARTDADLRDAGPIDAPMGPSVALGEPCTNASECLSGACFFPSLPGVQPVCAEPCGSGCGAGFVCDASDLCRLDNALRGTCGVGYYDANGSGADGCEHFCAGSTSTTELCNGVDDDCDLRIDESFPESGASCPVVGCGMGTRVCESGVPVCRMSGPSSVPERCNGTDEDCDGRVDEGCAIRIAFDGDAFNGPSTGDPGGADFSQDCPDGSLPNSTDISSGAFVDRFQMGCAYPELYNSSGEDYLNFRSRTGTGLFGWGGGGGASHIQDCPHGAVLIGFNGRSSDIVDLLQPLCEYVRAYNYESTLRSVASAPLSGFGGGGGTPGQYLCPPGSLVVGFHGGSGSYLDRLGVRCRRYHIEHR